MIKKYVKMISLILIILLMLQIILPVVTNINMITSYAETLEYDNPIDGKIYRAEVNGTSGMTRYWSTNPIIGNGNQGGTTLERVPILENVYLTEGSYIYLRYWGYVCNYGTVDSAIYISDVSQAEIPYNVANQKKCIGTLNLPRSSDLKENNIKYKITTTGYYTVDGYAKVVMDKDDFNGCHQFCVIVPQYYIRKYNINYNLNNGNLTVDNPSFYHENDASFTLNNPERQGYTFTGWTGTDLSSATKTVTIPSGSKGDREYTATWVPSVYTITLDNQSATNCGTTTYYEKYSINNYSSSTCDNAISKIEVPTKNGYTFDGYYTQANGKGTKYINSDGIITSTSTTFMENTTLIANWIKNNYQLEVRPNGGIWDNKANNQTIPLPYEGTINISLPTRIGYSFAGWNLEGMQTGSTISSLTADNAIFTMGYTNARLTANWKLITDDITGSITWNDQENKYTSRPSEVEVTLNSDEKVTEEGALETPTTKTVKNETYSFENLQTKKTTDNTDYVYTVSQNRIVGYETIVNGYDITNNLILPTYTSQVTTTPLNNLESELVKNEDVQIVGVIRVSENNYNKVGLGKEKVIFQIDRGIQISEESIKITYIDKQGNRKDITDYTVENNIIKVTFESNKELDSTAGDSITIELKGTMREVKEYTNTISYQGYLRDYETGEDTNINLETVTTASETIKVGKVSIAIKEINEEDEITKGSDFEIRKKETGEVVQSFTTEGKEEVIRKLEPMVEYVVVETKPIIGYTTAEEVIFMINEKGEIVIKNGAEKEENTIVIRDYKTRLQIEIKDELTNEYVIGPAWQLIKKTEQNGQITEEILTEWTSEGKEYQIEKLPIGEYILREVSIGEETGYVTIGDIAFSMEDTKELQILEVEQKVSSIRMHLKDIETEEYVEGAVLQIIKRTEEDGKVEEKVVREWTTKEEGDLELKLPLGDYIIREIKLPEHSGYETIEDKPIKVVDTLKEQQVELEQGVTKIRIEIVDEETKEKIDNVEVEIIDKETGEVIKLKETEEGYEAKRVPVGEYIIREKTPDGYKELKETEIKVEDTREVQIKKVQNQRLIYDMQVEKELVSITIDGEKKLVPKGEMQKVEIQSSKINSADIRLEYTIRVNNVGETKTTIGTIIDNIPEGFKLVSTDWQQEGSKAVYNAEKEELEPSKSREVRIILKWENNESNFGEKKNTAELRGNTNPYGYEDKTLHNNIGEEIVIFSIKTGLEEKTSIAKIIIIIFTTCMAIYLIVLIEILILKNKRGDILK